MKALSVLISCLLLTSSYSFAEWVDMSNKKNLSTIKETFPCLETMDRRFFIPVDKSKKGINIHAGDLQCFRHIVKLRYLNSSVDYSIEILRPFNNVFCQINLDLLDEEQFLVKSIPVDTIHKNFTGDMLGKFKMDENDFKTIQYYRLALRY
jgi:hypothetical protein